MKSANSLTKARRELTKFWLQYTWPAIGAVVLLVLVLGVNFGLGKYNAWVSEQSSRQLQAAASAFGQGFTARFNQRVAEAEAALDIALLGKMLASEAPAAIEPNIAAAVESTAGILGARFVEVGASEVDRTSFPPVGYAVLDMVRRTERSGAPVPPEVLFFGSENQQISLVRPLSDGGRILGHVLVALDVGIFQAALDGVGEAAEIYAEIDQPVQKGKALRLAQLGDQNYRANVVSIRRGIPGTRWRLSLWQQQAAAKSGSMDSYVWGGLGALALLLVVGGGFAFLRKRKPGRNQPVYDGAAAQVKGEDKVDDGLLARFDTPTPTSVASEGPPPLPELDAPASGIIVEETEESVFDHLESAPELPSMPFDLPSEPPSSTSDALASAGSAANPAVSLGDLPPASVFRAYDIRGVVGVGFGAGQFRDLGRAIGSEAYDRGQQTIVVARDGRLSSPELHESIVGGLRDTGRDVIDIGLVPTPVLYFATYYLNTGSGVMVTASHNPLEYNGLKIMLGGETLFADDIVALRNRLETGNLQVGEGNLQEMDLLSEYIRRVSEDIPVALGNAFRLVLDCGNGAAGVVAPKLFRALGHDVIELYCDVDGSFPNHAPDTSDPDNLKDLVAAVTEHEADLGFGFDGDGDRLAVVDSGGDIILPDRLMMLYARDILSRNPGAKIVYDVKCSSRLGVIISKLGGHPVMWKTGHSFLKSKLKEEGAELAGDLSGHIFFEERWYGFDDAMYAAARLLEILMAMKQAPSEILAKLPSGVGTPEIRVELPEGDHLAFMERFTSSVEIPDAEISTIDGVRADFIDGWGLVRASNTTPALTLRFEAHSQEALERIQAQFKSLIHGVDSGLELPF